MNDRFYAARQAASLSRKQLAEQVHAWILTNHKRDRPIDEHHVGKIERGEIRWPNTDYRAAFRAILNASGDAELGFYPRARGTTTEDDVNRRDFLRAATITGATSVSGVSYSVGLLGGTATEAVRHAIDRATRLEHASQFAALAAVLPSIRASAEELASDGHGSEQEGADLTSRVDALYAWLLIKKDQPGDAQRAARRALDAARRSGATVLVAASLRCLGEVHLRAGRYDLACDLAVEAADLVVRERARGQEASAVRGAGLLSASMACARRGDARGAAELLSAAEHCGTSLGRDIAGVVVFGPSNVDVHRVAIAMELGDAVTALQWIDTTPIRLPAGFGERSARYLIDVARAYVDQKRDEEAVGALLAAEREAPEEVHVHRLTRSVVTHLLKREHRARTPEVRDLADRCGVLRSA